MIISTKTETLGGGAKGIAAVDMRDVKNWSQ